MAGSRMRTAVRWLWAACLALTAGACAPSPSGLGAGGYGERTLDYVPSFGVDGGGPSAEDGGGANDAGALVDGRTPDDTTAADGSADNTSEADAGGDDAAVYDTSVAEDGAGTGTGDTGADDTDIDGMVMDDTGLDDTGASDTTLGDTSVDQDISSDQDIVTDSHPPAEDVAPDTMVGDDTTQVDTAPADTAGPDALGGLPPPAPGQLVITEIHANPAAVSDADGEWFEACNVGPGSVSLAGVVVGDAKVKHVVVGGAALSIPVGGCAVFAAKTSATINGGVSPLYGYNGSFSLNNTGEEIVRIEVGATLIDEVTYTPSAKGWPAMPNGASYMLSGSKLSALANDSGSAWCVSAGPTYGAGDKGTPGAANGTCP